MKPIFVLIFALFFVSLAYIVTPKLLIKKTELPSTKEPTTKKIDFKTYTNTIAGITVQNIPSNWVSHNNPMSKDTNTINDLPAAAASYIFLGPAELDKYDCHMPQEYVPYRYIQINISDWDIESFKQQMLSGAGGSDVSINELILDGQKVNIAQNKEALPCDNINGHEYANIFFENKGKLVQITTDIYLDPVVRNIINSIKLEK